MSSFDWLFSRKAALYQQQQELRENSQSKEDIHYDNVIWQSESYAKGVSRRRSSLIFEPADGRVPPLTANAQKRAAARAAEARSRGPADAVEYPSLGERCISWGNEGPPMLGATYYNNLQILQSSNAVVIRHELMHGIRVIPLDGRPMSARTSTCRAVMGAATGRQHPCGRDDEFHRQNELSRSSGNCAPGHFRQRESASARAFHARRRRFDPLPVHTRRPDDVDETLDGRDSHEEVGRSDLPGRVPRGQLRPGVHSECRASAREASVRSAYEVGITSFSTQPFSVAFGVCGNILQQRTARSKCLNSIRRRFVRGPDHPLRETHPLREADFTIIKRKHEASKLCRERVLQKLDRIVVNGGIFGLQAQRTHYASRGRATVASSTEKCVLAPGSSTT